MGTVYRLCSLPVRANAFRVHDWQSFIGFPSFRILGRAAWISVFLHKCCRKRRVSFRPTVWFRRISRGGLRWLSGYLSDFDLAAATIFVFFSESADLSIATYVRVA